MLWRRKKSALKSYWMLPYKLRQPNERISYYAFTATPKAKTLELFGRPPDPTLPAGSSNKPEPFHLYSMRQAIEEGYYP